MEKYVLGIDTGQTNLAGTKAKQDISYFLNKKGFKSINIKIPKRRINRLLIGKFIVKKNLKNISDGIFVFQYPMYSKMISKCISNTLLKYSEIKKVLVIHDVESLRLNKDEKDIVKKEIDFFNRFDKVVSHNEKMTEWLIQNGLKTQISNLNIFDYNNPLPISSMNDKNGIVFAGNLNKSKFLKKLNIETKVSIMGPNPDNNYPQNVNYLGTFSPDEVPAHLHNGFGLVWDGNSIETCNGLYGEYMKYNNPHKTSLYISSGIPVIIWEKSAMANFIKENKIGIVVSSLKNLDNILKKIEPKEYMEMVNNVDEIANKLRNGDYIYNAIFN